MTTHTVIAGIINTSDATYRQWVQTWIDALKAVGMIQTPDTGQINTATAIKPTAASTFGGFAVFRFDDAAQQTHPIFLRFDFGIGTYNQSPNVRLTVGKGTDGAGGITSTIFVSSQTASAGVATCTWYASGGSGYVAILPAVQGGPASGNVPFFLIERSSDRSSLMVVEGHGSNNSQAVTSFGSHPALHAISYESGAKTSGIVPVVMPYIISGQVLTSGTSIAAATLAPVFPWVYFAPSAAPAQSTLGISFPGGDAPGSTFSVTLGGEDRTYMPVPISAAYNGFGLGLSPSSDLVAISRHVGLAVRWQ